MTKSTLTSRAGLLTAGLLLATGLLSGCASPVSGSTYSRHEARGELSVRYGVLKAVRAVQLQDRGTLGLIVGGTLGAMGGSSLDKGRTGAALGVLGAIGGAALGEALDRSANSAPGLELTIRLETGATVVVVQELRTGDQPLEVGKPVQLIGSGSVTRVAPR